MSNTQRRKEAKKEAGTCPRWLADWINLTNSRKDCGDQFNRNGKEWKSANSVADKKKKRDSKE
jgi:hypothetical protein